MQPAAYSNPQSVSSNPMLLAFVTSLRGVACQLRRALSSAGPNAAEAFGNASGNARLRFLAAKGSRYEAQAAIQIAVAWGVR